MSSDSLRRAANNLVWALNRMDQPSATAKAVEEALDQIRSVLYPVSQETRLHRMVCVVVFLALALSGGMVGAFLLAVIARLA